MITAVAVASDKAGNTAQDTEDFIVDLSGPTITIDPIDETNDTTPTISGKTDEGSTVNVEIKDKDLVWTSSLTPTDTGDGACELFRVSSIEWIEKVKG